MSEGTLRIARVIEVNGTSCVGELEASVDDLYRMHRSRRYVIGQIGSIVKIVSSDILIFGLVTSLRMAEQNAAEAAHRAPEAASLKWIEIELFGQGVRRGKDVDSFDFERGISTYPLPGQPIVLATVDELRRIYSPPAEPTMKVGQVAQAPGLPVHLKVDELLGKHAAILGTTGSGKSCAVALLLQSLVEQYPHAHVVLLDPHNEYPRAFPACSQQIDPTTLRIPHWLLNLEESISLFIGRTEFQATSQTNILKEALLQARTAFATDAPPATLTVDTPAPYRVGDLREAVDRHAGGASSSKRESHDKILAKIDALTNDRRMDFLLTPDDQVTDSLADIVSDLLRIPTDGKPISIIDLSGVPSDVVNLVVSVLCRTIFDFAVWNRRAHALALLLVCEEAHRYAPASADAAFEPTKRALARIAKEGRKYGVGLMLVSQRPSELDQTIVSQCNTVIALRMSNDADQQFVRRALPETVRGLVDSLPALRTREALVVGEGSVVPVKARFDSIEPHLQPRSTNVSFSSTWSTETPGREGVEDIIRRWRNQARD